MREREPQPSTLLMTRLKRGDRDDIGRRAQRCGLSREGLLRLRSLVEERGRQSWAVGDVLVNVYGVPRRTGHADGSQARLAALAEELGCSLSWLNGCRTAAGAWPERERRLSVAFSVHRHLALRPDRIRLLAEFREACARERVIPSRARLIEWLDGQGCQPSGLGRRPVDPVDRLERLALRLDHEHLALLIERLRRVLATEATAA